MILEMECTCGACPVQYQGRLENGKYFYFRARWATWEFAVGDTLDNAVEQTMLIKPTEFVRRDTTGEDFSASWMDHGEAERIIRQCVDEYMQSL